MASVISIDGPVSRPTAHHHASPSGATAAAMPLQFSDSDSDGGAGKSFSHKSRQRGFGPVMCALMRVTALDRALDRAAIAALFVVMMVLTFTQSFQIAAARSAAEGAIATAAAAKEAAENGQKMVDAKAQAVITAEERESLDIKRQIADVVASLRIVRSDITSLRRDVDAAASAAKTTAAAIGGEASPEALLQRLSRLDSAVSVVKQRGYEVEQAARGAQTKQMFVQPQLHEPKPAPGDPPKPPQQRSRNAPAVLRFFDDEPNVARRNELRRAKVKEEFKFSWDAYKHTAWGHDELRPVTRGYQDWSTGNGVAMTAFDALSTLILMNMTADVNMVIRHVTRRIDWDRSVSISFFEATIRIVAALLSAYELTGETNRALVDTAKVVADKLLVAFNTTTGLPHQQVNLKSGRHWSPDWTNGAVMLAEAGSVQLELRTLSFHLRDPIYDMKATHAYSVIRAACDKQTSLCGTALDPEVGVFQDRHMTLGALGDSFYEYIVKQFVLTGGTEQHYRDDALSMIEGVIRHLVKYSTPSRQAYLAELIDGVVQHRMDELTCFAGGMLALAALRIPDTGRPVELRRVAERLTMTCVEMARQQNTGLAPESVLFTEGKDFANGAEYNLLRPETLESLFYMWRLTHEEKYRDAAWDIVSAFFQHCRVPTGGYSGVKNVGATPPLADDVQQSFWLAETLKYAYLIFSEDDLLPLHDWVLNTEAHPFRVRHRDPMDVWREAESRGATLWDAPTVNNVEGRETEAMKQRRLARNNRPVVAPRDPLAEEEPSGGPRAPHSVRNQGLRAAQAQIQQGMYGQEEETQAPRAPDPTPQPEEDDVVAAMAKARAEAKDGAA